MNAPATLKVIIENKDTEEIATLIQFSPMYHAAEYEGEAGERFYVDMTYLKELNGKPAKIPSEVIRQLADMRTKLAEGQEVLNRQGEKTSKESNLILPPGY